MKTSAQIYLFGSLRQNDKERAAQPVSLQLESPASLPEVCKELQIPSERVQLAMVNHRAVAKRTVIQPGDRVALFPREYPIFADWNGFR